MKYNIPDMLLREISDYAYFNGIQKVILFASRARGDHTKRSDIDIATIGGNADSFYWDVKEKINTLLTFDIVEMDKDISKELKKKKSKKMV